MYKKIAALVLAAALLCSCTARVSVQRIPAELPRAEAPSATPTPEPTPAFTNEQQRYGSAALLTDPTVLVNVFLNDAAHGCTWDAEDRAAAVQRTGMAVDWINAQAAGYGAAPQLICDRSEDGSDAENREGTPESPTGSVRKSSGMNIERRQQHHDMPEEAMSRQQRMSRMHEAFMYDQCQCTAEKAVVLQKGQEGSFEDGGTPPCTLPQHAIKEGEVHREGTELKREVPDIILSALHEKPQRQLLPELHRDQHDAGDDDRLSIHLIPRQRLSHPGFTVFRFHYGCCFFRFCCICPVLHLLMQPLTYVCVRASMPVLHPHLLRFL